MSRVLAFVITAARVEFYVSTLLLFIQYIFIFLTFPRIFLYLCNVLTYATVRAHSSVFGA